MSRFFNRKSIALVLIALALVAGFFGTVVLRGGATNSHAAAPKAKAHTKVHTTAAATDKTSFCNEVSSGKLQVSSGARMYCFGPQPNGPASAQGHKPPKKNSFGSNVDAASPAEDVSPNGTQAYGQSEVSTAGTGPYVVEQWNDATGFFSPPCSPGFKDQLSGWGFSSNGGASFTDEGGLPNSACATSSWSGDPSVEVWSPGGTTYFYQSSLFSGFPAPDGSSGLLVALTACKVSPPSTITCNPTPTILADFPGGFNLEDKDFMSIDPVRGILYVSFTDFNGPTFDDITLWACDIGTNPAAPACNGPLYIASSNGCENEGAYPAADLATGDVYVAYEHNWATNQTGFGLCGTDPVQNRVNQVGSPCSTSLFTSGCPAEDGFPLAAVNITSMDAAFIPGYNRFPMNDFPRIAVSDKNGTVSIVWNDARNNPGGDILLQSFALDGLFPAAVQSAPVRINSAAGGWHFLPALRNVDDDGDLQISFYQRAKLNTDVTDVYAAIDVSSLATTTPSSNVKVTTGPSAWIDVSSDITPNFGDYTDNYVIATPGAPFTQQTLYVAWSDGRLGDPQPFNAHAHTT